jgi:hypothetical protein
MSLLGGKASDAGRSTGAARLSGPLAARAAAPRASDRAHPGVRPGPGSSPGSAHGSSPGSGSGHGPGSGAGGGITGADLKSRLLEAGERIRPATAARRARRPAGTSGPGASGPARTVIVAGTGALAVALLLLAAVAWSRPTSLPTVRAADLHQQIDMTYQAEAPVSGAYPGGRLTTGDPVFTALVKGFDVHLAYRVSVAGAPKGTDVSDLDPGGTRRVTAELRAPNGWHRGYELLPRTPYTGAGFNADVHLDLNRIASLAAGLTKATGIEPATFTLAVRSEIGLSARLPGRDATLRETFFPEMAFSYDGKQVALTRPVPPPNTGTPVGSLTRTSRIDLPASRPAHLAVLGLNPRVTTVRGWALLAALALLGLATAAERARRSGRRDGGERVVRRIVLDDPPAPTPATRPARDRVPGPRTAALAERQWPRPTTRR